MASKNGQPRGRHGAITGGRGIRIAFRPDARPPLRLALGEWHARIPDYRLDGEVGCYTGIVMGVTALPLRWA